MNDPQQPAEDSTSSPHNQTDFHGPVHGPVHTGSGDINIQQVGQPSSITVIGKKIEDIFGWSDAPPETRQSKGKMLGWLIRRAYSAHPWFWRTAVTIAILLPLLWSFWLRPFLTTRLNTQGAAQIAAGEYSQAIQSLQYAARLQPDDARTHYNLGNAYDLAPGNEEQAIIQFKKTIELDDKFWPAYNNLARLYILTGSPDAALTTLHAGLRAGSDMPRRETAIFQKNMGWAYLGQIDRQECPFPNDALVSSSQQTTAENALTHLAKARTAMQTVRETGENVSIYLAEIYLLQGCAYEALGQPEAARQTWSDSLAHASAVLDSDQCTTPSGTLLFDCLKAADWVDALNARLRNE